MDIDLDVLSHLIRKRTDEIERIVAGTGYLVRTVVGVGIFLLDHDGNVSPWLELARDLDLKVEFVEIRDDTMLDLTDLEWKLTERTRVVAFPLASNAVGTLTDAERIVELAHAAGALAWADAVHYAPHGRIDVAALDVDVLLCSPYKFFGPHLGIAYVRRDAAERWRPYKVRPQSDEPFGHRFETGTQPYELLAGMVAADGTIDAPLGRDPALP